MNRVRIETYSPYGSNYKKLNLLRKDGASMKAQLLGVMPVDFTNNNGDNVRGTNIFVGFEDENVEGLRTEKFFVKDGISLPKDTKLNDTINISFNYKGK